MTKEKQREYITTLDNVCDGCDCCKRDGSYEKECCIMSHVRFRPYDIDAIKAAEREKTITLFEEIENGISSYEKENEHKQVHDECKGIYIPINVVRRLITVRKESLLKLLSCDSQDGG